MEGSYTPHYYGVTILRSFGNCSCIALLNYIHVAITIVQDDT